MDRISQAWATAEKAFEGIMYGDLPYMKHLRDAHDVVVSVGIDDKTIRIATILHDCVEDTVLTVQDIERDFGWRIAQLVWAVSDGPGKNRQARHANTYSKIYSIENAIIVKLADRIANLKASIGAMTKLEKSDKFKMYLKERDSFKGALLGSSYNFHFYEARVNKLWDIYDATYKLGEKALNG